MKKIYAVFILVFVINLCARAQATFIKQISPTAVHWVTATSDGGYLVTAGFYFFKYDAADNLNWSQYVGDSLTMNLVKVVAAKDGGYIVLANTGTVNNTKVEVIKLDSNRAMVWRKRIYGSFGSALAEDWAGNIVLAYYNTANLTDSRLAKLDRNGNALWATGLTLSFGDVFISSLIITSDKHYAVAGDINNANLSVFDSSGTQG